MTYNRKALCLAGLYELLTIVLLSLIVLCNNRAVDIIAGFLVGGLATVGALAIILSVILGQQEPPA